MDRPLSLSVLWSEDGGPPRPGRVELSTTSLVLSGGPRSAPESREVPLDELAGVHVGRRAAERLSGRAALHLRLRGGGTIAVASLAPAGTLTELVERLAAPAGRERPVGA
ncbi:MAG TPA: hypothetical protein VFJ77_00600 [Gaiellaceae bacterium]|nr:hypothetical protein [Gaiellaceae bacterium]